MGIRGHRNPSNVLAILTCDWVLLFLMDINPSSTIVLKKREQNLKFLINTVLNKNKNNNYFVLYYKHFFM